MENEIQLFSNEQFDQVRVVRTENGILFCGSDVARALGYSKPANAISRHCKGVTVLVTPSEGGCQNTKFITEGDVYRLITHSKLPSSQIFESWVFDVVIPSIRKHGGYLSKGLLVELEHNPDAIFRLAEALVNEREKSGRLEHRLALTQPKADYFDAFVNPYECTNIRTTAKELAIPERHFCKYLQHARLLYRAPAGNLMPYAKPFSEGFFIVRDFHYWHSPQIGHYTLITAKGKNELLLRRDEILAWRDDV